MLEKLELADRKLVKQAETLPTVEAEVRQRLKALSKVGVDGSNRVNFEITKKLRIHLNG